MLISKGWKDYEILDTGDGYKLERWGEVILSRPDPQVIWPKQRPGLWERVHAEYTRSDSGGGSWDVFSKIPDKWRVSFKDMRFTVKAMGFKHTGVFPEQSINWEWMAGVIASRRVKNVLNLFGYTGAATIAAAKAGASVVHVDAAKGMVAICKENAEINKLSQAPIRYIVDDVFKFVEREIRRNHTYDGIIMDPPSFGRGPSGQVWKLEDSLYSLCVQCSRLMSGAGFFILNSYTAGLSAGVLGDILRLTLKKGEITSDEIGLPISGGGLALPCGCTGRWSN